jgi:hypothetical protein
MRRIQVNDVIYRVEQTKSYIEYPTIDTWAVRREEVADGGALITYSTRIAKYRDRETAQAVAAILEALADREV